jgi:hypothetical protein
VACSSGQATDAADPTDDGGSPDAGTTADAHSGSDSGTAPGNDSSAPTDSGSVSQTDSGHDAGAADTGPTTATKCFQHLAGPVQGPNYDQFNPVILPSCAGTHHQNITGVERVVFLGDSITTGTPPSLPNQIYRVILGNYFLQKFGPIEIQDCSQWGAKIVDLIDPAGHKQMETCFPNAVDTRKTLVVMTNGGNDISGWAKNKLNAADALAASDVSSAQLRTAMNWLKDPTRFPNGTYVLLSNDYEYTDTSGDLSCCPAAALSGFTGTWSEGAPAVVHLQEQIMKVVVDLQLDMIFLLEDFCGHGYKRDDPTLQCYRGPNTPLWFDISCYHPNPTGHAEIAKLFQEVTDG